jgi:hypothetical protein
MQVHPQISQFITLVLISPNFKPSHPSNLSSTSITFYTQHFRSINESLSLCPQFEQQFFFWNNAVMNPCRLEQQQQQQIGTETPATTKRNNKKTLTKSFRFEHQRESNNDSFVTRPSQLVHNKTLSPEIHPPFSHRTPAFFLSQHPFVFSLSTQSPPSDRRRRHHLYRRRH